MKTKCLPTKIGIYITVMLEFSALLVPLLFVPLPLSSFAVVVILCLIVVLEDGMEWMESDVVVVVVLLCLPSVVVVVNLYHHHYYFSFFSLHYDIQIVRRDYDVLCIDSQRCSRSQWVSSTIDIVFSFSLFFIICESISKFLLQLYRNWRKHKMNRTNDECD